jgi:predicted ATP-dependent endonuclease of OLD family
MHLHAIRVQNFRRLRDVVVELQDDISIFVGANNSGKTSVAQVLQLFLNSSRDKFTFHDFNAASWSDVEDFSNAIDDSSLPKISIDIWLALEAPDLHRAIDLLPSLAWQGSFVGIRIVFAPVNADATLSRFREAQDTSLAALRASLPDDAAQDELSPSPDSLTEFLTIELKREYELQYYVLDHSKFDNDFHELEDYVPLQMVSDRDSRGKKRSAKDIIDSLIRVDFLHAQRHLSDSSGGSRTEDLSRHLSRFYERNLEKRADDYEALKALSESENSMNEHLEDVFKDTLQRLETLSYPGLTNLRLKILSDLNPAILLSSQDGAKVHYALDDNLTLPDKHNGLGYKNLIYMVVELLDLHSQWVASSDKRPPLHLIFIEEPEAHLHTQLQQVFVNKILDILPIDDDEAGQYSNQLVITTHSPHILYERGFQAIRYFRRENTEINQSTCILNLSKFYADTQEPTRHFLERYLKLTHCDLFFSDAAILVEGNVERLLMPLMINSAAPRLKETHVTILEIGGAFGHRFQSLIEFLGITALIITDLDSVYGSPPTEEGAGSPEDEVDDEQDTYEEIDEDEAEGPKLGSTCRIEIEHAETSNQTLIQWLPREKRIQSLLEATEDRRTQSGDGVGSATVRVCYQTSVTVITDTEDLQLTGRTLEEAFAFENLTWSQDIANKDLKLRVKSSDNPSLQETTDRLHKRIHGKNFGKTDFALALLTKDPATWTVPSYIAMGLQWLEGEMNPAEPIVQHDEIEAVEQA